MELIMFVLFMGGKILFTAIMIFLMAIPSGMGLGVGLHAVKKFFRWRARKNIESTDKRADNYKDFLDDVEVATAGVKV